MRDHAQAQSSPSELAAVAVFVATAASGGRQCVAVIAASDHSHTSGGPHGPSECCNMQQETATAGSVVGSTASHDAASAGLLLRRETLLASSGLTQYVYPLSPCDLDQNQDFLFKDNAYN